MSIDEARRLLLHDAARTAWGAEAALVLMEMLPPTGWADVATRRDLDQLEARTNHRFDQLEAKLDHQIGSLDAKLDHQIGALDAKLDHQVGALRLELAAIISDGQRRSIQWNVGTIIAVVGIMTAILRLG